MATISRATLNDLRELNDLINGAYRGESSKKGWTTEADLMDGTRTDEEQLKVLIQRPDSMILKCVDENQNIQGCVHLEKHGERLYLGLLTVSPESQGKGTGKSLLKAAEDEAEKLDVKAIYMNVITVRTELVEWYLRHGYEDHGERKPFAAGDPRFGIPKEKLELVILEKKIRS